jgi:hypothetical protein
MTFARILIVAAILVTFTACGGGSQSDSSTPSSSDPPSSGAPVLLASGGTGTSGSGGNGGSVYIRSYGSVQVLKSGTVDASFPDPSFSPDFGDTPFTVTSNTTVVLDEDPNDGNPHLYAKTNDPNLYLGNGNDDTGDDPAVTGLRVMASAALVLVDQGYEGGGYATLQLANDLVIYGTVTTDLTQTPSLYIEANVIDVESGGKITVSATDMDGDAGEIYLGYGYGITKQIINRGTIEAKGLGSGNGGYLYFETDDLVVNYGTIDASGGSSDTGSGGYGGELDAFVDYGDFYSSGTVHMNGGNGTSGGDTEAEAYNLNGEGYSVYIVTTYVDNTRGRNGDIIISGTWEANGGDGTAGNGGYGGLIILETDALGAVTVNATMSARGGDSSAAGFSGGSTYGIGIYSSLDPNGGGGFADPASPGKIRIAGQYDISGGDGDETGGAGGLLGIYSDRYNAANIGSDVELVGFPTMNLNGGQGANGGSASGSAFELYTESAGDNPAGAITNEAKIEARGGKATGAGGTGGLGGYVDLSTDSNNADSTTTIANSGNIDVAGGTGDTGGGTSGINLQAQHVTNSGDLTANGGNGTTAGGDGGNITLNSSTAPTTNSGTLSADGGTGSTPGASGTVTVD